MVTKSTFGTLLHRVQVNITYKCIREQENYICLCNNDYCMFIDHKICFTSLGFVTRHLKFHQKEHAELAEGKLPLALWTKPCISAII